MKRSFFGLTLEELTSPFSSDKEPFPHHWAKESFKKIYKEFKSNPQDWDFPKKWESWIIRNTSFNIFEKVSFQQSTDQTTKFLFTLSDKLTIETVLIPFEKHYSICLSTQVGCAFGCTFCSQEKRAHEKSQTS